MHSGILGNALRRHELVIPEDDIRPDLIRNHLNLIFLIDLHGTLDLPALPHPAARIVRGTENRRMNVVLADFFLHILIIHAPHAILIQHKRTVHDLVPVIFQAEGKSDIGRRVHQHLISPRTEHIECA